MRQLGILLGFVLATGVVASGTPYAAAADPLDGKVFRSADKLPGGERRDGTVVLIHWEIRFKDKAFSWRHTDVISTGSYEWGAQTGALVVSDSKVEASFDARTGVLTWDKQKYEVVKEEK
jgi:hypothetical protein